MDAESQDCMEEGKGDVVAAGNEVANDRVGRHQQQRLVLPPGGLNLKLEAYRHRQRGPDESSAGTRTPDTPDADAQEPDVEDKERERDRDKGRKRRKHRRVRPNKKVWLWKKELTEATAGLAGREGSTGAVSPTLLGRLRSTAALPAPNNTNQFLMEDHKDLPDLDLEAVRGSKTSRARDSSFSIDSEDEVSSSPEDEAYLSKEFSNTYDNAHVERLGTMSKLDLIQEFLQLEQKVDVLEKKLKVPLTTRSGTGDSGGNGGTGTDSDSEVAEGEMPMEPAMAEKIRIFQEEIQKLVVENEQLLQENQRLQSSSSLVRPSSASLSSSMDSESDSSTSSGSSSTSSSGQSKASKSSRGSRGSRGSGASRSSSASSCNRLVNGRSSPDGAPDNKNLDVEMDGVEMSRNSSGVPPSDQEMETEVGKEELMPKVSPHHESSVISSVVAH